MILMESLALISAALSICVAAISIWKANSAFIRRLALIQKKLDCLRGLTIALQARMNDLEKFNSITHGYHIRGANSEIEKQFLESYEESDTGF